MAAILRAIPKSSYRGFSATKTETFPETLRTGTDDAEYKLIVAYSEVLEKVDENNWKTEEEKWSGRVDLNHRLHGPEPCALPS